MQPFTYENPTQIIFGNGTIEQIGQQAAKHGTRALLVTGGSSLKRHGTFDRVTASLEAADVAYSEFSGVRPNPVLSHLRKGIEAARTARADVIVAVGGGSVLDEAKAIAAGTVLDYDIIEYLEGRVDLKDALPVVTAVTVAATGSEMNGVFVITNEETKAKNGKAHDLLRPKSSILDPELHRTLPLEYTAYAAVDIVSHATEGFLTQASDHHTPIQDGLVQTVVTTIHNVMDVLLGTPEDTNARGDMLWASTLAWNGICTAGIGPWSKPCHMLGHPLSAMYDTPHGATLSLVTPAWMRYQAKKDPTRIARFGRMALGIDAPSDHEAALSAASAMTDWYKSIGAPVSFTEAGIASPDYDALASRSYDIAAAKGNAGPWSVDAIKEILHDIPKA